MEGVMMKELKHQSLSHYANKNFKRIINPPDKLNIEKMYIFDTCVSIGNKLLLLYEMDKAFGRNIVVIMANMQKSDHN